MCLRRAGDSLGSDSYEPFTSLSHTGPRAHQLVQTAGARSRDLFASASPVLRSQVCTAMPVSFLHGNWGLNLGPLVSVR